jgi:hypothetical protein
MTGNVVQVIKSRARVKALGEVFTQPHEVNAMLDLIPADQYTNPLSTWLEPACGTGNFLLEILKRKVAHATGDKPTYALKCLSSLYGIDISLENVQESRIRLERYLGLVVSAEDDYLRITRDILSHNIIKGDSLNGAGQILIWEYHWQGSRFTRTSQNLQSMSST